MPSLTTLAHRLLAPLHALRHRRRHDAELDEEMQFHLDRLAERYRRDGMTESEAARRARVTFGGTERFKEETRDARGGRAVEDAMRDLRHAARALRRAPGFTTAAVASLALGIGAVTAVFALAHAVLLAPLPYPDADRLVAVGHATPGFGVERAGLSDATFRHYREHGRALADLAAYFDRPLNLTDGADPELVDAALVTPNLFAVLGAAPLLGRTLTDAADGDPDAVPAVVLSHALWARRYGGDRSIVGRTIEVNRLPRRVVGVMPPGFAFPSPRTQLWFSFPIAEPPTAELRHLYLAGVGRLRDGATADDAAADLRRLTPALAATYPDATPAVLEEGGVRARVVPLLDDVTRDVRPALVLVFGTALFILLATWVNVANLSLVRAERRAGETAIARALGAGTVQVVRRALAETLLLAAGGGALGLLLAALGAAARFGFDPLAIPRLHELRAGGTVLLAAGALTLASAVVITAVSLVPVRGVSLAVLRDGRRATAGRRARWGREALVASQVALSLALLVGAALLGHSYHRLRAAELGFDPARTLAFDLELPYRPYPSYQAAATFFERLHAGLRAVPGVESAESSSLVPLTVAAEQQTLRVAPEQAADEAAGLGAVPALATPGYFAAMRIPVLRGRAPAAGDLHAEVPGLAISAALARAQFGDDDPVGRRVTLGGRGRRFEVVGVVGDVPGASIADGPVRALYIPVAASPAVDSATAARLPYSPSTQTVVVRTTLPAAAVLPAVRRVLRELDPKVPIARLRWLDDAVDGALARTRLTAWLLGTAAGTALLLALLGVYGVLSYAVSQREREFGLRIALGAQPSSVRALVLRDGARMALVGTVAGALLALALGRLLRGLLYLGSPHDPRTVAAVSLLLLAVALGAALLPARRAARVDPAAALRGE